MRIYGWILDVALLLNRLALGTLFFVAGYNKLSMGYDKWLPMYDSMSPAWLPKFFSTPYGYAVPVLEALFGALLVLGLFTQLTASVLALMLASFTIAVWQAGMFFKDGDPFHNNVLLFTLALLLAVIGAGGLSVDALLWKRRKPSIQA